MGHVKREDNLYLLTFGLTTRLCIVGNVKRKVINLYCILTELATRLCIVRYVKRQVNNLN